MSNLRNILTRPMESDLWGTRFDTPNRPLYYRDNRAKILGVAHLDSVMESVPTKIGPYVICPQLDDRLGAWVLLSLLPKMGVNLDVLLTTGEEILRSSGEFFAPGKDYNWIVEFDRSGDDVVFYQYDEFAPFWKGMGFEVGQGSFSDIAVMDHLGVLCANVGIGYHNQHTRYCHVDLRDTIRQVKLFRNFYNKYYNQSFPYNPYNWDGWSDWDDRAENPFYDDDNEIDGEAIWEEFVQQDKFGDYDDFLAYKQKVEIYD